MTEPEGMDELRARLGRVEEDVRVARYLGGATDRDVGEFRTELREFRAEFREYKTHNNGVLNAMREDLVDLRADLTDLRGHVDRGFAQIDRNFLAIRGVLDGLAAHLQYGAGRQDRREDDDRPSP